MSTKYKYINTITPAFASGKYVYPKVGEEKIFSYMMNNKSTNKNVQKAYKILLEKIAKESALDNAKLTTFLDEFKSVLKTEFHVS